MNPDKPNYNQPPSVPEFNQGQPSTPEQPPAQSTPEFPQPRPEAPIIQPEKDEPQPERQVQPKPSPQADGDQSAAQTTLPPVQTSPPAGTVDAGQANDDDTPLIADDVDVIEKTWVDKAKQIVEDTKDDPHRQEQEVEKLQQSYLKKRYGKVVKPSES